MLFSNDRMKLQNSRGLLSNKLRSGLGKKKSLPYRRCHRLKGLLLRLHQLLQQLYKFKWLPCEDVPDTYSA